MNLQQTYDIVQIDPGTVVHHSWGQMYVGANFMTVHSRKDGQVFGVLQAATTYGVQLIQMVVPDEYCRKVGETNMPFDPCTKAPFAEA
jgi:hypothetical protein